MYGHCVCFDFTADVFVCMQECERFTKTGFNALDNLLTELLLKQISSENLESIYKVCM